MKLWDFDPDSVNVPKLAPAKLGPIDRSLESSILAGQVAAPTIKTPLQANQRQKCHVYLFPPDKPKRVQRKPRKDAKEHYKINLAYVNDFKQQGCSSCQEKDTTCLDLHHVDPSQKARTISTMIRLATPEELIQELSKCIVLCANCHRKLHNGQLANKR